MFLILLLTTVGSSFGCAGFGRKTPSLEMSIDYQPGYQSSSLDRNSDSPVVIAMLYHGYIPEGHYEQSVSRNSSPALPIVRPSEQNNSNKEKNFTPEEYTSSGRLSARMTTASASPQRLRRSKSLPDLFNPNSSPDSDEDNAPDTISILSEATSSTASSICNSTSTSGSRTPNNEGQFLMLIQSAASKFGLGFKNKNAVEEYLRQQLIPIARHKSDAADAAKS